MLPKLYVASPYYGKPIEKSFKSIQDALLFSHRTGLDLYEEDMDGPELIYSNSWTRLHRKLTWITLRTLYGTSTHSRRSVPANLRREQ